MIEQREPTGVAERRWVAATAAFGALALQLSLPAHLVLPPRWLLPATGLALLVGVVIANPDRCDRRSMGLRRASIALVAVMSIANAASAARLIDGLLSRMEIADARFLLRVGATIWVINVVVFALWYWELDGGGPARRLHDDAVRVDLMFPQHGNAEFMPPGWRPQFVD